VLAYLAHAKEHPAVGRRTYEQDHKFKAIGALRRLEKRPGLVCAFFADAHLRYITA